MELYSELEKKVVFDLPNNIVSVTGGGGKTTLLKLFGRYLSEKGYSVLITTTTKIQSPEKYDYGVDRYFTSWKDVESYTPEKGDFIFYAEHHPTLEKMISPELENLSILSRRFDVTLIEADGSRHLPLKYHSSRDPVILEESTSFISIMGADGIGKVVEDVCFGLEGDYRIVDGHFLKWYLEDPEAALKGKGNMPGVLIVNRADENPVPEHLFDFEKNIEVLISSEEGNEIYNVL